MNQKDISHLRVAFSDLEVDYILFRISILMLYKTFLLCKDIHIVLE